MSTLKDTLKDLDTTSQSYDSEWIQFIQDHMIEIRNKSNIVQITPEEMFRYRYRPEDYLDSINVEISLSWIMMMINQIQNRQSFNSLQILYIPNSKYIDNLKEKFGTYKQICEQPETEDLRHN